MKRVYDKEFKLNAIRLSKESKMNVRMVEKELGIGSGCISQCRKKLEKNIENAFPGNGNPKDKGIYELKKKIAEIELENKILKKAIAIFSGTKKMKYKFMYENKNKYQIEEMAKVLEVSKNGYYEYLKQLVSMRKIVNLKIVFEVKEIHKKANLITEVQGTHFHFFEFVLFA